MNLRSWTFINDDEDRSDYDEARLNALARRWSEIHHAAEQRSFARQSDFEEGRDCDEDECNACDGRGTTEEDQKCEACDGSGFDNSREKYAIQQRADEDVELEIIEAKLHSMGARMMRPYEHWNEDERYMEYMERDR
jgi:hypothetical protein